MRPSQPVRVDHGETPDCGGALIRLFPNDVDAVTFVQLYRRLGDPRHRACLRWLVFELAEV
jgi:hypothetical protein